jgi:hypothetical protein
VSVGPIGDGVGVGAFGVAGGLTVAAVATVAVGSGAVGPASGALAQPLRRIRSANQLAQRRAIVVIPFARGRQLLYQRSSGDFETYRS